MTASYRYPLDGFGQKLQRADINLPPVTGEQVLLRVTHAGVCHSDVHIQDGYQDLGNGARMEFADSSMPLPLVMGHEIVGEVIAVGPRGDASLVGKSRLVYPWIGCGACTACGAGRENHCEHAHTLGIFRDGGYAQHVLVPASRYLLDIEGLDPAWACTLACSGLTVYSALEQLLPIAKGGALAVMGAGGLGLAAVGLARAFGVERIIACDLDPQRLAAARRLGADEVLDCGATGAAAHLIQLANGQLCAVLDTVGAPSTLHLAMDSVVKGSRIVLLGLQGGSIDLALPLLPFKALAIIGSYTGSLTQLHALIGLAREGRLPSIPIEQRPLCGVDDALDELRSGRVVGRIVLNP